MASKPIRVLVVDDSPVIREMIVDALTAQPDFVVVGTAADGYEALQGLESLRPDVVTLDLQMPRLDGPATLEAMLRSRPTPVIVVSSLAKRGAEAALQALDLGAMDYLAKPEGTAEMARVFGDELPQKVRNVRGADVCRILQIRRAKRLPVPKNRVPTSSAISAGTHFCGCIAIGVSTGGPPALARLFGSLVPPLPPIVVVQHMPATFTGPFAARLDSLSAIDVKEAATGDVLRPNAAYVAPGGKHLSLERVGGQIQAVVADGDPVSGHKPSVGVMLASVARLFGKHGLGVIMTGMGRDGADGCVGLRRAGGLVFGQDEATSDVYGMNKVAFAEGGVDLQLPLSELAEAISIEARRRCVQTGTATKLPVAAGEPIRSSHG